MVRSLLCNCNKMQFSLDAFYIASPGRGRVKRTFQHSFDATGKKGRYDGKERVAAVDLNIRFLLIVTIILENNVQL